MWSFYVLSKLIDKNIISMCKRTVSVSVCRNCIRNKCKCNCPGCFLKPNPLKVYSLIGNKLAAINWNIVRVFKIH